MKSLKVKYIHNLWCNVYARLCLLLHTMLAPTTKNKNKFYGKLFQFINNAILK